MKLVTNLNGDFFCPFQGLIDMVQQLPDRSTEFYQWVFKPICELKTTNDWINLESLGKPVAVRAHSLNEKLTTILTKNAINHIELHVNLGETSLTIDNVYLFLFLAESITSLDIHFYTLPEKVESLQQMTHFLHARANIKLHYKAFEMLAQDSSLALTLTQLAESRYRILQTVGFGFHQKWFEQPDISTSHAGLIIGYAWLCLKAGAYELGCRVLEKALTKLTLSGQVQEQLFINLQLVRFLSHQYRVVTNEVFPEHFQFLEKEDMIGIYFIKAYAATLDRNLSVAEVYFKKCHIDQHAPMTDEASLYRLNIYALFLVLKGEIDTALTLEMQIKEFVETHHVDVVGLKYVNFINIARLQKKLKQFDQSFAFYQKAYYEISEGGYTTSDHIYYNLNLANLYESAGDFKKALIFWLKMALYWLAFNNPHALSWRPRLILCQEKMTDILMPLSVDKVNQIIYDKLKQLLIKAEFKLNHSDTLFHFILEEQADQDTCYVTDSIILYSTQSSVPNQTHSLTEITLALRKLVSNLIKQVMNIEENQHTLVIDTKNETNYPSSVEASLVLAILSGCKVCYYQGKRISQDEIKPGSFLNNLTLSLSKAIDTIQVTSDGLRLLYKRSFLNKVIRGKDEIDLITKLNQEKTIKLETLQLYPLSFFLKLIQEKVIYLSYEMVEPSREGNLL